MTDLRPLAARPTGYPAYPPQQPLPSQRKHAQWVVPVATSLAVLNDSTTHTFMRRIARQSQWQAQKVPEWLMSLTNTDQWLAQRLNTKLPQVSQRLSVLGQQPTLGQLAGLSDDLPLWRDIQASRGGAWWRHVRHTVGESVLANKANSHTYGLTPWELISQPKHWGKTTKVMGKALNASFTRPYGQLFNSGQQAFSAGLTTLALGAIGIDIAKAGLRANQSARQLEDGSADSRWNTFKETIGTIAHRTAKSGAIWFASSVGVLLGHLAFKAAGLGHLAGLPKVVMSMIGGATLGTLVSRTLDTLSPNKY
jgi:hypothetical protein